jgi:hypothetical protein
MGVKARLAGFAPWAAASGSALAVALTQQGLSTLLHFTCRSLTPASALLLVGPALLLVAAGVALTWPALSAPAPARRFSARVSLGLTVLLTLPVLLQYAATLALPPCAR